MFISTQSNFKWDYLHGSLPVAPAVLSPFQVFAFINEVLELDDFWFV